MISRLIHANALRHARSGKMSVPRPRLVPMSDSNQETIGSPEPEPNAGLNRDPEDWVTGDEPMTAAQRSYLDTLAREAGEELPADLSKADASKHIDRLQQRSNRVGGDGDNNAGS